MNSQKRNEQIHYDDNQNLVTELVNKEAFMNKEGEFLLEDLFELLGDVDVIECNEVNVDIQRGGLCVDSECRVYFLENANIRSLKETGKTILAQEGTLKEVVDTNREDHRDFLKWYFSAKDVEQALKSFKKVVDNV